MYFISVTKQRGKLPAALPIDSRRLSRRYGVVSKVDCLNRDSPREARRQRNKWSVTEQEIDFARETGPFPSPDIGVRRLNNDLFDRSRTRARPNSRNHARVKHAVSRTFRIVATETKNFTQSTVSSRARTIFYSPISPSVVQDHEDTSPRSRRGEER